MFDRLVSMKHSVEGSFFVQCGVARGVSRVPASEATDVARVGKITDAKGVWPKSDRFIPSIGGALISWDFGTTSRLVCRRYNGKSKVDGAMQRGKLHVG